MERWNRRDGSWIMEPGRTIINLGEAVFIPDFVFRRKGEATSDERRAGSEERVYLEILGFWTPRWLKDRLAQLERSGLRNFLLAASDELRASREPPPKLPPNVIVFKSSLDVRAVEDALDVIWSSKKDPAEER